MIVVTTGCALLRLLPTRLSLWKAPLRWHTWPAFALGFLVLAVWYVRSVTPYSVPIIVDGVDPDFQILHVEKEGLHFHETEVAAFRQGRAWFSRQDRRLFQFRFKSRGTEVAPRQTSPPWYERTVAFAESPELWKLRTQPAKTLWSWDAEGWYVILNRSRESRILAFTSEYRTVPPHEVTDMFHEIERLPAFREHLFGVQDISLGFGYDPRAAMGFGFRSCGERTRLLKSQ
jgi:hypothetical protein